MNKGASHDRRLHVCVGPRRGFQKLHCLYDGLTVLYATHGRKSVDTTDDPALEWVEGGSRLYKRQKKLVFYLTTKRLESFGTMRGEFPMCGI